MTRLPRALSIATLLILAACTSSTNSSPSAEPTATPEPTPTASASPEPTPSPSAAEPTRPKQARPRSQIEGEGGFTWEANAEADALMLDRFDCQNLDDGYQVDFPAEWNTNAEFGSVPTCSWFAPTEYETGAPGSVPDEVAIEIFVIDGDRGYPPSRSSIGESGFIGATQPATRVRVTGNDGRPLRVRRPARADASRRVRTSSPGRRAEMGGDFDLNRAVLDRMMATMEFIGVIQ